MSNGIRTVDTLDRRVGALWSAGAGLAHVGRSEVTCATHGADGRGRTLGLVMSKLVAFVILGVGAEVVVFRQAADLIEKGEGTHAKVVEVGFAREGKDHGCHGASVV